MTDLESSVWIFRVSGSGFRVQGSESSGRIQGSWFREAHNLKPSRTSPSGFVNSFDMVVIFSAANLRPLLRYKIVVRDESQGDTPHAQFSHNSCRGREGGRVREREGPGREGWREREVEILRQARIHAVRYRHTLVAPTAEKQIQRNTRPGDCSP